MKLVYRLIVFSLGLVTILATVVTLLIVDKLYDRLARDRADDLARAARLVSLQWTVGADPVAVAGAASAAIGGRVTLIDKSGTIVGDASPARGGAKPVGAHAQRPEVATVISGEGDGSGNPAVVVEDDQIYVALRGGQGIVRMAVPTRSIKATMAGLRADVLTAGLFALGWALLFAVLFARHVSKPVIQLRDMAHRLARREFAGSPPIRAPGEVGELADSLFRLSDRLVALERARSDFIANVSHELCSPLTIVHGFAATLARNDPPPEARREFADAILSNATRMQRVIDDMLDLSRLESGGWVPRNLRLDVDELVEEALRSFRAAAAAKGVALSSRPDARTRSMEGDKTATRQIISNLLDNAIRHTSSGAITIESRSSSEGVWLTVADTGEGIPKEHLSHIFERFYRVDDGRARSHGGTGLGLAIVKHLVDAHGGRVEVESRTGIGTAMSVLFPQPPVRRAATPATGTRQVSDIVAIRT
ncbi:MAG: ATP-binding protein [Gemmatimonadales bacterium]